MLEFIDTEVFRQCFYGTVFAFYGIVLIWMMFCTWTDNYEVL
ncbi:hypothetical protein UFOVP71_361 [uncultured Caudovirales phage]|uniref:Uncharacterized protein n=1 Tax=uncultured Caudovirales phage TaxID=2100421 RepID=A0A6J5TAK1_9CAUD|nr:hypothetical protein UFOVP71_361 [uncultured Caudovirales phage]